MWHLINLVRSLRGGDAGPARKGCNWREAGRRKAELFDRYAAAEVLSKKLLTFNSFIAPIGAFAGFKRDTEGHKSRYSTTFTSKGSID